MQRLPTSLAKARLRSWGEARQALLRERRVSLTDIARDLGKSLPIVSRVTHGERRSREIEREIARRLRLSISDAFPEWRRERPG